MAALNVNRVWPDAPRWGLGTTPKPAAVKKVLDILGAEGLAFATKRVVGVVDYFSSQELGERTEVPPEQDVEMCLQEEN